jgi:hypothetical protein
VVNDLLGGFYPLGNFAFDGEKKGVKNRLRMLLAKLLQEDLQYFHKVSGGLLTLVKLSHHLRNNIDPSFHRDIFVFTLKH